MNVLVTIEGRKAIPVRALPYVYSLDPHTLIEELTHFTTEYLRTDSSVANVFVIAESHGFKKGENGMTLPKMGVLRRMLAYHIDDGHPTEIEPNDWHRIGWPITSRTPKERCVGQDYSEEIALLPAGTFVWTGQTACSPWIPENMRRIVMEGFERFIDKPAEPSEQHEGVRPMALSDEAARYWMNQPEWGEREAGLLLQAVDPRCPISIELLDAIAKKGDIILHKIRIRRPSAVRPSSPAEWTERAKEAGIPIPKSLKPPPNWEDWMLLESAEPRELAALSLNIDPKRIDRYRANIFPDDETAERFESIERAINQQFKAGGYGHVNIAEFVAWADSKNIDMPAELHAMGGKHTIPNGSAPENSAASMPLTHDTKLLKVVRWVIETYWEGKEPDSVLTKEMMVERLMSLSNIAGGLLPDLTKNEAEAVDLVTRHDSRRSKGR